MAPRRHLLGLAELHVWRRDEVRAQGWDKSRTRMAMGRRGTRRDSDSCSKVSNPIPQMQMQSTGLGFLGPVQQNRNTVRLQRSARHTRTLQHATHNLYILCTGTPRDTTDRISRSPDDNDFHQTPGKIRLLVKVRPLPRGQLTVGASTKS
jgi:hypothetical protein